MIKLEYLCEGKWISAGLEFLTEQMCWTALGGDDFNYRTVDVKTGKVLTDKSKEDFIND